MVIVATARVPRAPSGTLRAPLPRIASTRPPPSEDCRKISKGSAGNEPGSADTVSCNPMRTANSDAIIPVSGPATEKSNMDCKFFGGSLKEVTVVVTPVMMDGTKVGKVGLICGTNIKICVRKITRPELHSIHRRYVHR